MMVFIHYTDKNGRYVVKKFSNIVDARRYAITLFRRKQLGSKRVSRSADGGMTNYVSFYLSEHSEDPIGAVEHWRDPRGYAWIRYLKNGIEVRPLCSNGELMKF